MEGKAVLFKRFADVDSIDLEVDTTDAHRFIEAVELLAPSFGGINLEDIAAPDCFIIEQALKERMNIPVFHDDQHGTAIITAAGLINACHLTGREAVHIHEPGAARGARPALLRCLVLRGLLRRTGPVENALRDSPQRLGPASRVHRVPIGEHRHRDARSPALEQRRLVHELAGAGPRASLP